MGELSQRVHRAIGNAPDGGSVMKMMTITAALEHTKLRASSMIDCGNGEFRFSKKRRHPRSRPRRAADGAGALAFE